MTQFLKQSTAATVKLGPFVDATDGFSAEASLTISQADIRLSKNGAAFAQTNNAAGATHDENGYYGVPLNTTDTGTLGHLRVAVNESGALPVWQDFMVLPAMIYDSLVAGSDRLDTNATHVADTALTARDIGASVLLSSGTGAGQLDFTSGVLVTVGSVSGSVGSVVGSVGSVSGDVNGGVTGSVGSVNAIANGAIDTATFAAGTTIPRVTLADTLSTYTGNVPQTGDSFARIGVAGAGLTAVAPASTALSTATWTAARAGYLDNVNNAALQTTAAQTGDGYPIVNSGTHGNAALKTLVDSVKTDTGNLVTRITSTLFSGITSLANWLRAMTRSDAANATALSEINLSGGTYAEATHSLQGGSGGGGGGGDATLAKQNEILAKINPARVLAVSSVTNDLEIEVHSGDDKDAGDTNSLEFTAEDQWAIFGGGAAQLSYKLTSAYEAGTGTWTNIGSATITQAGTDALIKVSLTAAETGGLATSPPNDKWHYTYRLRVTQVDGDVITAAKGAMTVTQ